MRPLFWKLAFVATVGLALGAFTGQATIAGMAPPIVSSPYDHAAEGVPDGSLAHAEAATTVAAPADQVRIVQDCPECSDYDLGYRFAASRRLSHTVDCMDYSWSYQRGCLAYLRDG